MLSGQDIVCFANDWDADPTSKHQVMKILARHNRVLWVNSIGLRRPGANAQDASRIIRKLRQFCRGAVPAGDNLRVLTPLVIPFHGNPLVKAINAWLVGHYVRRQARKLGMNGFHLWTFMPTTAPFIRHLRPKKVVYYCVDEWSAFSFLDQRLMEDLERRLIRQSDLVITTATALYASKRRLHPHTYLVPHGVDGDFFARARAAETEVPAAIQGLPGPVIGFWGLIHEWIDLDLIRDAAARRPGWSFVLIGKVGVDCAALERLPNVHLLGKQSYESLVGYAKGFTAAMLPFKVNRLTDNVNPIKLREYLAAGLPVVSTPLPEVRAYADVVRVAATPDAFVAALDQAVRETGEAAVRRRMEAVSRDTWVARVEQISTLVENTPAGEYARAGAA